MSNMPPSNNAQSQQGVVILEVMIAILIFSMGILGLVGLQAAMIKNTAEANYRAEANYIAQQRIGEMWADQSNLDDYLEEDTDISSLLPNGARTVTFPDIGQVRVVVTWQQPGDPNEHNLTLNARIVANAS